MAFSHLFLPLPSLYISDLPTSPTQSRPRSEGTIKPTLTSFYLKLITTVLHHWPTDHILHCEHTFHGLTPHSPSHIAHCRIGERQRPCKHLTVFATGFTLVFFLDVCSEPRDRINIYHDGTTIFKRCLPYPQDLSQHYPNGHSR